MKQQHYFDNNWMLFLLFNCCIQCRLQWKSMWMIATKLCCNIHCVVVHSQYYMVYWLHNNCCHCTIISDMWLHWSACKSVGFCCNFFARYCKYSHIQMHRPVMCSIGIIIHQHHKANCTTGYCNIFRYMYTRKCVCE